VARTFARVRSVSAALERDRPLTADIERVAAGIRAGTYDPERP
jgi:histidine ammonia-lyase